MRYRIVLRETFFQGSSTVCRALCSEHTHMRGLLIAKDDRPCGIGSRFPRALLRTRLDDAIRYAMGGKRQNELSEYK